MRQGLKSFFVKNDQIFRFLLVGGIAVIIDAFVYAIVIKFLGANHGIAKRLSFIIGSVWAFLANKKFTFGSAAPIKKELILFVMLYMSSYLTNGWVHDYFLQTFSISWFAFLTATAVSTCINYVGQKFVVFRKIK